MKAKVKRGKKGTSNTHFVIQVGMAKLGTIYIPNEIADKHPDVEEFEIDLPFEE